MKFSYKHLLNYIIDRPDIQSLSNKLFHLGHEHEINGDIIDLELTPNRGDCLSLTGLLRDLNLFYEIKKINEKYDSDIDEFDFAFENKAIEACPKISFLEIEIESVPENYNLEIENYFSEMDIKKNNFFTDISNYISYETGQPTHCYDAKSIQSGLKLESLKEKQQFETLLDKTIELDQGDLVFLDNKNRIVNLAGIVGSKSSSCNKNTKSVILECAYFLPEHILGKAVKYSINSDAAYKFERSVDPNCHDWVIRRFIKIVEQHTNITNLKFCSNVYVESQQKVIGLDIKKINKILGTDISEKKCIKYMESFSFIVNEKQIIVPPHRNDIGNINDIAEEVARAIGYDNITPKKFLISPKSHDLINNNETNLKNLLIENGFHEVINDPFTSENNENSIEVDNPLDSSRRFLRTSLKESLLHNLIYNERRQQDSIKLFEIADIYSHSFYEPKRYIGIIVSGRVDNNYRDFAKKLDKKYLNNFLEHHIGKIDSSYVTTIDRDNFKSQSNDDIAYLEIELDKLDLTRNNSNEINRIKKLDKKYIPISEYPSSIRDLSFSITDFSQSKPLQDYLLNFQNVLLKDVFIFDYFYNEKKAEIKIGFRFIFESKKATITEKEINKIIREIVKYSNSINGVTIPGLDASFYKDQ